MREPKRIIQANLNNQGGAFSLMHQAQMVLFPDVIFDYFSANKFIENETYRDIQSMGGLCFNKEIVGNKFVKQYKIYKQFKDILRENKYEIVHVHADTAWKMFAYLLAAKRAGVQKIIVHSHSSGINGHYKAINYLLHILMRPIINKYADCKCACSVKAAEWMYNKTENIHFVQNGVNINKYQFNVDDRNEIRNKYNITEDMLVIGTVGDFSWAKNPSFIRGLIRKMSDSARYKFLLVGDGPGKNSLEKELIEDGTIDSTIFIGRVTNPEKYLSAMDVFILPSRFEGLPISALEAQVNGAYTIVSDNITPETNCSKYYKSIRLNEKEWADFIRDNVFLHRSKRQTASVKNQISIGETAQQIMKLYE